MTGDCEIATDLAPVWGDSWDCYHPDDCIWDIDGWDPEDDSQVRNLLRR